MDIFTGTNISVRNTIARMNDRKTHDLHTVGTFALYASATFF